MRTMTDNVDVSNFARGIWFLFFCSNAWDLGQVILEMFRIFNN